MALWSLFVTHLVGFKKMIFICYSDIHSNFINIGLPTDPSVEDRILLKQRYCLEWPYSLIGSPCN